MNTCTQTPVIAHTDIVVFGGGLAALSAALTLAESKNGVIIVNKETFLLEDICLPHFYHLSGISHAFFNRIFGGPVIHPDRLKINAEDLVTKAGIAYLYAAVPLDVSEDEDGKRFLRIAGKFGINGIICRKVLDLRYSFSTQDRMIIHAMNGPDVTEEQRIAVKTPEGRDDEVILRPGSHGKGHITLDLPLAGTCFDYNSENIAHHRGKQALEAFRQIKSSRPEYASLELGRFAETGYASAYDPNEQIQRGLSAALDLRDYLGAECNNCVRLPEELELASYNDLTDFDESETRQCGSPCFNTIKNSDLVVVGGGTAGALAAIYAARQGVKTILLELNGKLGGTGTVGGVSTYWFGKRHKETIELDERIQRHYDALGLSRKPGIWSRYDDCNPDVKAFVLLEMCREAGVQILFNSAAFAAIVEKGPGKKVRGIAAVTPEETLAVLSRYVIDASGDGDMAAFSHAAFNYGSSRDALTFWASLAQYTSPKEYKNNFSSTVMVSNLKDYTRFITAGRRRGENTYDHGIYVAPRESRHIKGLCEITLREAVSFEEYEDTLYTCFSNYDPKGKLNADMVYAGVLPSQNAIAVPLRALIPVDTEHRVIEGLLVAGKAFSCTHNAFPGLRMQPDLQHQGAVLGILLGEAMACNTDPLHMDIKGLQDKIRAITGDSLKLHIGKRLETKELVAALCHDMRFEWTDFPFEQEVKELPASIQAMTAPSGTILSELENRYLREQDTRNLLMLARFILWHGSDMATETLLEDIMSDLEKQDELPEREGSLMCVQLLPDHGVMAETVYKLNLLAWSKRTDIYKPFLVVLTKLSMLLRDYRNNRKSIYHYMESFAYVAERTGLPQFVPMLKVLLQFPELGFREIKEDGDILAERHLILQMSLCRALARCGDLAGFEGLIDLLSSSSEAVSVSACMELRTLTGKMWGKKPDTWREYIYSEVFTPVVNPIAERNW